MELETALVVRLLKLGKELGSVNDTEDADRQKESPWAWNPLRLVDRKSTTWHDAMYVWMVMQFLVTEQLLNRTNIGAWLQ
jgi:hypothetical protein